ncbi:deoxyribodipyrimidine photo-lyase [Nocardioides sp. AE5]|uniref:cryptochrome/photolyase family protein n=1 Tax=Nocardioides sp. AE5 TaxID=2962573 RepID=UPI002882C8B7|nr:deoxyribodipyrimidine photo-lyase [Nocardioides sp. AE5]MDT0201137.1 deoxyribodipyrimidine photo-lyase [Nocardioides sp. AE5]
MSSLLWLRRDLRRLDLPALGAARDEGGPVAVAFVVDPRLWNAAGAVRRAWVAANVLAVAERFDQQLVLRVGNPAEVLPALVSQLEVGGVHVSAETTPYGAARDAEVERALSVPLVRTGSPYAVGPGLVRNGTGGRYKVFTPFSRAWRERGWPDPAPEVRALELVEAGSGNEQRHAEKLLRDAVADCPIELPAAGEEAARRRWREFLDERLDAYAGARDNPAVPGTTGLSPYLKVGAIHPRTMLADLAGEQAEGARTLRDEIAWREFYADVVHHEPNSAWRDLRPLGIEYDDPRDAAGLVQAWREGRTGFPIVDAGMRQLAATGWMHNRVRMITASFLTKDLHLWWPVGARHFLDLLIDGDLASNNHGWQWVAGTGTDASPYFRVFNPVTQGLRFDPNGDYVRRWVPELAGLAGKAAHEPWKHGGSPGYPEPIVDHAQERAESLERYGRRSG